MSDERIGGGNDHLGCIDRQRKGVRVIIDKLPRNQISLPQVVVAKLHGKTRFRVTVEGTSLVLNAFGGKYNEIESFMDFFAESCDRTWGSPNCEGLERVAKLTPSKRVTLPVAFKSHYENVEKFELILKGTALILRPLREQ